MDRYNDIKIAGNLLEKYGWGEGVSVPPSGVAAGGRESSHPSPRRFWGARHPPPNECD